MGLIFLPDQSPCHKIVNKVHLHVVNCDWLLFWIDVWGNECSGRGWDIRLRKFPEQFDNRINKRTNEISHYHDRHQFILEIVGRRTEGLEKTQVLTVATMFPPSSPISSFSHIFRPSSPSAIAVHPLPATCPEMSEMEETRQSESIREEDCEREQFIDV